MSSDSLSLTDFVERKQQANKHVKCWLCHIPQVEEVEAAAASGVTRTDIVDWLQSEEGCNYGDEATLAKVTNHLKNHVSR